MVFLSFVIYLVIQNGYPLVILNEVKDLFTSR